MGVFQWILWNLSQQFLIEHMRTVSVKNHFSAENNLTKQKRLHKNVKLTRKYLLNCNMVSLEQVFFPKTLKPISCQCFSVPIVKSFRIRRFSGPYISAFGLNVDIYGVNLRIQSKCWKMRTRKTPSMNTFCAVYLMFFSVVFFFRILEPLFQNTWQY